MTHTPGAPAPSNTPNELTWPEVLNGLVTGHDLSADQTRWVMAEVMSGGVTPAKLAGFLMGLRAKGETVAELTGLTEAMLDHAIRITVPGETVDIVGTGGDRAHTVNISTTAAIVVAATGLTVVKHGNRAASSRSGSADVLEALGIRLDHEPDEVAAIAEQAGITFCFAATFHPSMRFAGEARKELAIPTAFNFLGPLTTPAAPDAAAVGCADLRMAPLMAGVFAARGTSALVFRGDNGLDELAATGPATIWEVRRPTMPGVPGEIVINHIDAAADLGLTPTTVAALRGGSAEENAQSALAVLDGTEQGPIRETVLLNAAAAIVAAGTLPGTGATDGSLIERLRAGYDLAARAIDDGAALKTLNRWRKASRGA
ncbi:MAG: anthranilate phosphoribosyltransferase [Promicromonosporaceae bacterium]|nr:anthranilate phosphoribosyltransferase [Promicromonosporaceae bacterium]